MKRNLKILLIGLIFILALSGCSNLGKEEVDNTIPQVQELPQPISEDAKIIVPEVDTSSYTNTIKPEWKKNTHRNLTDIAASTWGISSARIDEMTYASDKPDEYQSGLNNSYNQQWSHAYLWSSLGTWIWGDADDDFHDNLNQSTGELESPEGYNNKSAKYYYERDNQQQGDWYVGYACHYVEDAALILHASDPTVDMLSHHFDFEQWIANNWTSGHNFRATVDADGYYYVVDDPKAAIRNASYYSSYWTSDLGKTVWDNYANSGYPTTAGSGNSTLETSAGKMLIRAARYAKGTIKYALDTYSEWNNEY